MRITRCRRQAGIGGAPEEWAFPPTEWVSLMKITNLAARRSEGKPVGKERDDRAMYSQKSEIMGFTNEDHQPSNKEK